jgi:hypothetical protein
MIWIMVSVVAAVLLLFSVWGARPCPPREASNNAVTRIRSLDVESFRNLVDPAEEDYLRSRLQPWEFHRIQRERRSVAFDYISCAAREAAILKGVAKLARNSTDPAVVLCAKRIITEATRLRIFAFLSMWLSVRRISLCVKVADSYEQMIWLSTLLVSFASIRWSMTKGSTVFRR